VVTEAEPLSGEEDAGPLVSGEGAAEPFEGAFDAGSLALALAIVLQISTICPRLTLNLQYVNLSHLSQAGKRLETDSGRG